MNLKWYNRAISVYLIALVGFCFLPLDLQRDVQFLVGVVVVLMFSWGVMAWALLPFVRDLLDEDLTDK